MAKQITTAEAVINELGGVHSVARLLGFKPKRVWNWKSFGRFPAETYVALSQALEKRGKRAPASLWGMKELIAS